MKKKNFSRILAVLLTLAALMSLSVFAVEGETKAPTPVEISAEEGIDPHGSCNGNHTWTVISRRSYWESQGASGHARVLEVIRECSVCGVMDRDISIGSTLPHSYSNGVCTVCGYAN